MADINENIEQTTDTQEVETEAVVTDTQPTEDAKPEIKEPTTAELQAELYKYKKRIDELSKSEGNLRKQLKSKMTADEQAQAAEQEREEYFKHLERENSVLKQTNSFVEKGFTKDEATKIAEAMADGDFEMALTIQNDHYAKIQKAMNDDYNAKVAALMKPTSGNGSGADFQSMFNEALKNRDDLGAVSAILNGSGFLNK